MSGLTPEDFARGASTLGVPAYRVRAVARVESRGRGYDPDGRPTILFEAHVFDRLTEGRHRGVVDRLGRAISVRKWTKSLYGPAGTHQWDRMRLAERRDRDAAWKACSWGRFQVMGFNHEMVGFPTVEAFVQAMERDEGAHLDAFVAFVVSKRLDGALRRGDWAAFARGYNGEGYAANDYDGKLARADAEEARLG